MTDPRIFCDVGDGCDARAVCAVRTVDGQYFPACDSHADSCSARYPLERVVDQGRVASARPAAAKVPVAEPRFTVLTFEEIGLSDASIYRDKAFFLRIATKEGAKELCDLLNRADILARRVELFDADRYPAAGAEKIMPAIHRALSYFCDADYIDDQLSAEVTHD